MSEIIGAYGKHHIAVVRPNDGTQLVLSTREWTKIVMQKESSGDVVWGFQDELRPVASGKGMLLGSDPMEILLAPNTRLFIGSENEQKVVLYIQVMGFIGAIEQLNNLASLANLGEVTERLKDLQAEVARIAPIIEHVADVAVQTFGGTMSKLVNGLARFTADQVQKVKR